MENRDMVQDNAEPCQITAEEVLSHRHQKAIIKRLLSFCETTEQVIQKTKKSPRFSEEGVVRDSEV